MKSKLPITGIGSLPYEDIFAAVNFSLSFDIPFLPQMTSLNEEMISQAKTGNYLALKKFSDEINNGNRSEFKIQIAGPETSKLKAKDLYKTIIRITESFSRSPIIFLDEPINSSNDNELQAMIHLLKSDDYKVGIHSCNSYNLDHFLNLDVDYLSIDGNYLNEIEDSINLKSFFKKEKKLILGIIPTNEVFKENEIFIKYLGFIRKYLDYIILSPACGLASMTDSQAKACYHSLRSLRKSFINQA